MARGTFDADELVLVKRTKGGAQDGAKSSGEGGQPVIQVDENGNIIENEASKQIDKTVEQSNEKMSEGPDESESGKGKPKQTNQPSGGGDTGGRSAIKDTNTFEVDYNSVRPSFNWQQIIKRFVSTQKPQSEESFARPARNNATNIDIAKQTGAGAIKPGEIVTDVSEVDLVAVIDGSGSMLSIVPTVMSNLNALLKTSPFDKTAATLMQFSSGYQLWKVICGRNKAGQVDNILTPIKSVKMTHTAQQAIAATYGGGTNFNDEIVRQLDAALAKKYTVLICSDSDLVGGSNGQNVEMLLKKYPKNVFVIWDSRNTYIAWRKSHNFATVNMTYFSEK